MDSITDTFLSLLAEADSLLQQDPFAEQAIVVETAKENRYHCVKENRLNVCLKRVQITRGIVLFPM